MKKILLFVIACMAYVSVQAQEKATEKSITVEAKAKVAEVQKLKPLSKEQKLILLDYFVNNGKIEAGTFSKDLKANPPKDITMSDYFDKEQLVLIKKHSKPSMKKKAKAGLQVQKKGF